MSLETEAAALRSGPLHAAAAKHASAGQTSTAQSVLDKNMVYSGKIAVEAKTYKVASMSKSPSTTNASPQQESFPSSRPQVQAASQGTSQVPAQSQARVSAQASLQAPTSAAVSATGSSPAHASAQSSVHQASVQASPSSPSQGSSQAPAAQASAPIQASAQAQDQDSLTTKPPRRARVISQQQVSQRRTLDVASIPRQHGVEPAPAMLRARSLSPQGKKDVSGVPTSYGLPPLARELPALSTTYGTPPMELTPRVPQAAHTSDDLNSLSSPIAVSRAVVQSTSRSPDSAGVHSQTRQLSGEGGRQQAPPRPVECHAVFVRAPRCWSISVPPSSSVNDAVEFALQTGTVSDIERTSVSVLPNVARDSLAGQWTECNLDQPPLIMIKGRGKGSAAAVRPGFDTQQLQAMVEEQMMSLSVLQKQLVTQTSIIQNQESFIADLMEKGRQQTEQLEECVERLGGDIQEMKTRIRRLQEGGSCSSATGSSSQTGAARTSGSESRGRRRGKQ